MSSYNYVLNLNVVFFIMYIFKSAHEIMYQLFLIFFLHILIMFTFDPTDKNNIQYRDSHDIVDRIKWNYKCISKKSMPFGKQFDYELPYENRYLSVIGIFGNGLFLSKLYLVYIENDNPNFIVSEDQYDYIIPSRSYYMRVLNKKSAHVIPPIMIKSARSVIQ